MAKRRKKKIQDFDRGYDILRYFVDFFVKKSYRDILYINKENIPSDGAIMFAPNHTNTLMDALVILSIDHTPKVFVARADIFKNPILARIFSFLKIMPIMRHRDGFSAVKKNYEIIKKSVDVLMDKIPFCIFPEGTHQAKYSLLPLSKGILRIALQTHEHMPNFPLYIVPVGITYGDFFRYRSTLRMQFGKSINVGELIKENSQQIAQEQMNIMRETLAEELKSTTLFIPNDNNYDATLEICNIVESNEVGKLLKDEANVGLPALELQFRAKKNTLKRIEALKEDNSEEAAQLFKLAEEAHRLRVAKNIDLESVAARKSVSQRLARLAVSLLTLPYGIAASVCALPYILACQCLLRLFKDAAFWNSARFLLHLLLWPLLLIIYITCLFVNLPWHWALCASLLVAPSPIVAHELWYTFRLTLSDVKLHSNSRIQGLYSQIRKILK